MLSKNGVEPFGIDHIRLHHRDFVENVRDEICDAGHGDDDRRIALIHESAGHEMPDAPRTTDDHVSFGVCHSR
ncbi:MAG: hypothetical protein O2826_02055 [Chloroflexi bacterium]|nr:hypothetical protein [Chloroflexota bacterium]MDA1173282.1 hypothetical protein [Chloroflexota bacterium]